jgi:hypothetical protein
MAREDSQGVYRPAENLIYVQFVSSFAIDSVESQPLCQLPRPHATHILSGKSDG